MSNEVKRFLFGSLEDIVNGDWVVIDGYLVPTEVPELAAGGFTAKDGVVARGRGTAVVNHPHVVTLSTKLRLHVLLLHDFPSLELTPVEIKLLIWIVKSVSWVTRL